MSNDLYTTPVATLQYPTLANAKADDNGRLKYSACFIFDTDAESPEGSSSLADLKNAVLAAAVAKFGDKAKDMLKSGALRNPLRDGAQKDDKPGFGAGKVFFNASTLYPPVIVDASLQDILDVEGQLYPGCQVRAQINFYAYDAKGNRGVAAGLTAVQKYAEGTKLASGGIDTKAAFGAPKKAAAEDMWD